jgi:hypothetical protein
MTHSWLLNWSDTVLLYETQICVHTVMYLGVFLETGFGLMTGFIAHLHNLLLYFTNHYMTPMSSLLHHFRLPSQEAPSILSQPTWEPRYIASGRIHGEHCLSTIVPLSVVVAETSLPSSFQANPLALLFRLSGVMSQYIFNRFIYDFSYLADYEAYFYCYKFILPPGRIL